MGEAQNSRHDHQLWVNLSSLGDGNIFAMLPQVLQKMVEDDAGNDMDQDMVDVILPSDNDWQTKIYYKLVEKQRLIDNGGNENMLDPLHDERPVKLHDWNIIPKPRSIPCGGSCSPVLKKQKERKPNPITWTVGDIAKAGCLLSSPPLPTNFEDEQEMRRVYTLIYDVFRYKNVLTQALNDVAFFQIFPKLLDTTPHVWLLFYDLYHRAFKKRETALVPLSTKLFRDANLTFVENALWTQRVKLAASVSRLRIKHNALSLGDLLPSHLKDEKVTSQSNIAPVTCWVNIKKIEDSEKLCKEIQKAFNLKVVHDLNDLGRDNFKWDKHCPQTISFHASIRSRLARSDFIKNHKLIMQDKAFCLGPATFVKLITDLELTGSVIQTHVNSPRTTAYLATLLSQNEKIKTLLAFSAGKRKTEYEDYFGQLGMTNVLIFSDRLIDTPADAVYMEEVVAVFATPPNSYSAVTDPIDLVCSRGGDLSMLEVLTEAEETKEGKERVSNILEEQRKTLRFAMSRPQIQFVLYETHSELEIENKGMVQKALRDINRVAKLHHATLQGKLSLPFLQSSTVMSDSKQEINNNENMQKIDEDDVVMSISKRTSITSKTSRAEFEERLLEGVSVPETDIFDVPDLPNLCPNETDCINLQKEGCFLALLQRKKIIRLDDKYMIQMAENRGLFGSTTTTSTGKSKASKSSKKKQQEKIEERAQKKVKRKLKDSEIARIAAPTHAFLGHTRWHCPTDCCPRCREEDQKETTPAPQYRKWWSETTRHIMALRSSLVRQKILPSQKNKETTPKSIINAFVYTTHRVDEIAAKTNKSTRIPVFPKLKLSRDVHVDKIQIPLAVTDVEFPTKHFKYLKSST